MSQSPLSLRPDAGDLMTASAVSTTALGGSPTTTSLACYVQKGTDVTWHWGLKADNGWYSLSGVWVTTPYTGLTKFVTDTAEDELLAAARQSIAYYGLDGYTLQALFAADGSTGYNYPVVSQGRALFPKW